MMLLGNISIDLGKIYAVIGELNCLNEINSLRIQYYTFHGVNMTFKSIIQEGFVSTCICLLCGSKNVQSIVLINKNLLILT